MAQSDPDRSAKQKQYRSPALRLVGNPFKDLAPAQKELLMAAIAGNLVSVVVEDYLAEMKELQTGGPQTDSVGEAPEETPDNS